MKCANENCSNEFEPTCKRHRFCCTTCKNNASKRKRYGREAGEWKAERVCKCCGVPFLPSNASQLYCTIDCKNAAAEAHNSRSDVPILRRREEINMAKLFRQFQMSAKR